MWEMLPPLKVLGVFKVIYCLFDSPMPSLLTSFLLYKFVVKNRIPKPIWKKIFYSFFLFLIFMAITFTFSNMWKYEFVYVFSLILGELVIFLCFWIFIFFVLPQLYNYLEDFSKKKKKKNFKLVPKDTNQEHNQEHPKSGESNNNFVDESDDIK